MYKIFNESVFTLIILLISITAIGQKQIKIFTDENIEKITTQSEASFYKIINFDKGKKSGYEKIYNINGKLFAYGAFSYLDTNTLEEVEEGDWVYYNEDGKSIYYTTRYVNGLQNGLCTIFNIEGKPFRKITFFNGEEDEEKTITYAYNSTYYITITGRENNATVTNYYNNGDTVINYNSNFWAKSPNWSVTIPAAKGLKKTANFTDDFKIKETISNYSFNSDDKAKVEFNGSNLEVIFKKYNFVRSINLIEAPLSLNENDFNITIIISKESTAFAQGLEFGKNDDNFHRVHLVQTSDQKYQVNYEEVIDGNFVYEKTIKDIHYKTEDDNKLVLIKKGSEISISMNGYVIHKVENVKIYGNTIAMHCGGRENQTTAKFNSLAIKIETDSPIPSKLSLKSENGVFLIPVELNEVLKVNFIIDSGASDVSISPDIFLTLLKTGTITKNDWLPGAFYKFADGSTAKSKRFKLKILKIGDRTINDIICSVSNSIEAPLLLGQSALRKFGHYSIDNKNNTITFK